MSDTQITRVLSVEPVILPNCSGTSEITIRRSFTRQVDRIPEIPFFDAAQLGLSLNSMVGIVSVQLRLESSEEVTPITEEYELELSAAPGSTVLYNVQWVLVSSTGVIEIVGENEVVFVQFTVPSGLRVEVQEPQQEPCSQQVDTGNP